MFRWLDSVWHTVTGTVPATISRWVHDALRGLWSFLSTIFLGVADAWDDLVKDASNYIGEIDAFAVSVAGKLIDVYRWINKYGSVLVDWILHPSNLVDFIWDDIIAKLEREAWDVTEKLGKFFLSLIFKNIPTLIKVLEDILDAVL